MKMTEIRKIGYVSGLLGIAGSVSFPILTNQTDYRMDFSVGGWVSMVLCLIGCACLAWAVNKERQENKTGPNQPSQPIAGKPGSG